MTTGLEQSDDPGPLSDAEEAALRALHRGARFGIDPRSERTLALRGLVVLRDWQKEGLLFHEIPFLTDQGAEIAARLAAAHDLAAGRGGSGGLPEGHA